MSRLTDIMFGHSHKFQVVHTDIRDIDNGKVIVYLICNCGMGITNWLVSPPKPIMSWANHNKWR